MKCDQGHRDPCGWALSSKLCASKSSALSLCLGLSAFLGAHFCMFWGECGRGGQNSHSQNATRFLPGLATASLTSVGPPYNNS
jgi:hypothetical protein